MKERSYVEELPCALTEITQLRKKRRLNTSLNEVRTTATCSATTTKNATTRMMRPSQLPNDYPPFHLTTSKLKAFTRLLCHPIIETFHIHDQCCLSSDKYLLAVVLVYFIRADIDEKHYHVYNFFCALYLAHEIEEEIDDYKWEILPWALGMEWQKNLKDFVKAKNQMWKSMNYYGIVSKSACNQVMEQVNIKLSLEAKENCPILHRERNDRHGFVIKQTIRQNIESSPIDVVIENSPISSYIPTGPIWHHGNISEVKMKGCRICKKSLSPNEVEQHMELFRKAELESNDEIPVVLSQGLDLADSLLLMSDSSLSLDSEEVWSPEIPKVKNASAGRTGRKKKIVPEEKFDDSEMFNVHENVQLFNEKNGTESNLPTSNSRKSSRRRKILMKNEYNGDSDNDLEANNLSMNLFTQSSDEEKSPKDRPEKKRRYQPTTDGAIFDYEQAHRLRLERGMSVSDFFDTLMNQSVTSN